MRPGAASKMLCACHLQDVRSLLGKAVAINDDLNSTQVDAARNLLYVRGQVPGHKGNFVKVRDAVLKTFKEQPSRPVPTFLGTLPLQPFLAPKSTINPFE